LNANLLKSRNSFYDLDVLGCTLTLGELLLSVDTVINPTTLKGTCMLILGLITFA